MASQRPELTWDYDEQSDILYISFGEPVAAYSEHADESILLRYSMQDETLVGMTIIGYHEMGGIDALLDRLRSLVDGLRIPLLSAHTDELREAAPSGTAG
jgi:uncharacterized protein YuzE